MAMELPLPRQVFGHGWIMLEGGKMSKSKGNVVDPVILVDKYGVDAVRYYLIKELSFGQDGLYSEEMLVNRINSDLANDVGNLISRTAAMIIRYFDGKIPAAVVTEPVDQELQDLAAQVYQEATAKLENLDFSAYLIAVMKLVARANKYIDETEPWLLAKEESKKNRLATVMYNLAESIRLIITMLAPAMPTLPERANRQIQLFADLDQIKWEDAGCWGLVNSGAEVKKGEILFPRIDLKTLEEENLMDDNKIDVVKNEVAEEKEEKQPDYINIEDFARVDLRVAEVIACEKMEKADKLLVLQVRLGEEERTVVSGIAKNYKPEDLVGKKVILVANLKPTKLRGTLSQGMILAASDPDDNDIEVLTLERIPSGNRVK